MFYRLQNNFTCTITHELHSNSENWQRSLTRPPITQKKTKVQKMLCLPRGHQLITREPKLKPCSASRLSYYISLTTSYLNQSLNCFLRCENTESYLFLKARERGDIFSYFSSTDLQYHFTNALSSNGHSVYRGS